MFEQLKFDCIYFWHTRNRANFSLSARSLFKGKFYPNRRNRNQERYFLFVFLSKKRVTYVTVNAYPCKPQFYCIKVGFKGVSRREGNDQESIHLPNTFRSKTSKGRMDAFKVTAPQSKHFKQKAKPKNGQTAIQNNSVFSWWFCYYLFLISPAFALLLLMPRKGSAS